MALFSSLIRPDHDQTNSEAQFHETHVLTTNEIGMGDEEMLVSYKRLSTIEDCFRIMKTELESRPVSIWTKAHIQAHFLTFFIVLIHLRLLQHQISWKISPEKVIKALNSAKATR